MLHMKQDDLKALWARTVDALQQRYAYLTDRPMKPVERPPATATELNALEQHWGFALPPSYRMLLTLFNGAERFAYTTPLLSTAEIMKRREWEVVDELDPELVPYVFSASSSSDLFFALDPRKPLGDGELEVVIFTSDGGEERHPDIITFMKAYLYALEVGIERERADRDGIG